MFMEGSFRNPEVLSTGVFGKGEVQSIRILLSGLHGADCGRVFQTWPIGVTDGVADTMFQDSWE